MVHVPPPVSVYAHTHKHTGPAHKHPKASCLPEELRPELEPGPGPGRSPSLSGSPPVVPIALEALFPLLGCPLFLQ